MVFTIFAQYHLQMESYMKSVGLRVVVVNSGMQARARAKVIKAFWDKEDHVMIISNIGSAGLNFTFAQLMLIFDIDWSGVMSQQLIGHIHHPGQTKPCSGVQMVAKNTIDILLAMIRLQESNIAEHRHSSHLVEYFKWVVKLADDQACTANGLVAGEDNDDEDSQADLLEAETAQPRKKAEPKKMAKGKGKEKATEPESETKPENKEDTAPPQPAQTSGPSTAQGETPDNDPSTKPTQVDGPTKRTRGATAALATPGPRSKKAKTDSNDMDIDSPT
ncbi:P-loop containing nucleoside triphosphate hydrolase protein [Mycena vulgaris]|nr:P-loop containing nucleoside triphosphate hydrolase protein [Mycena vulgaris]